MAVLGLMNSWLAQETVDALIIYTDKRWSHVEETEFGFGPCDRFVWCSILKFCRPNLGHQDFDGSFAAKAGDGTQAMWKNSVGCSEGWNMATGCPHVVCGSLPHNVHMILNGKILLHWASLGTCDVHPLVLVSKIKTCHDSFPRHWLNFKASNTKPYIVAFPQLKKHDNYLGQAI